MFALVSCRSNSGLGGSSPVVFGHPGVEVVLQAADRLVDLLAESGPIELIEHGFVEALADSIGLRAPGFGADVIDVLHREIEFIFVTVVGAAIFGAAIGQNPLQRHAMIRSANWWLMKLKDRAEFFTELGYCRFLGFLGFMTSFLQLATRKNLGT
jgi:hypothetical protein